MLCGQLTHLTHLANGTNRVEMCARCVKMMSMMVPVAASCRGRMAQRSAGSVLWRSPQWHPDSQTISFVFLWAGCRPPGTTHRQCDCRVGQPCCTCPPHNKARLRDISSHHRRRHLHLEHPAVAEQTQRLWVAAAVGAQRCLPGGGGARGLASFRERPGHVPVLPHRIKAVVHQRQVHPPSRWMPGMHRRTCGRAMATGIGQGGLDMTAFSLGTHGGRCSTCYWCYVTHMTHKVNTRMKLKQLLSGIDIYIGFAPSTTSTFAPTTGGFTVILISSCAGLKVTAPTPTC
jgi:hypothetical protein